MLDQRAKIDRGASTKPRPWKASCAYQPEACASLPVLMEAIATSPETCQPLRGTMPVGDQEQRLYWESHTAAR
ncbi:hypothetical protein GCM10020295_15080 [Streptomyces cinereospinus]